MYYHVSPKIRPDLIFFGFPNKHEGLFPGKHDFRVISSAGCPTPLACTQEAANVQGPMASDSSCSLLVPCGTVGLCSRYSTDDLIPCPSSRQRQRCGGEESDWGALCRPWES
uniref:Uncharacterized protein n=1 Tax=Micrurus lemniscatus lemniscatus TaxID=129467 RepID=A0A2D4JRJ6_MICLE